MYCGDSGTNQSISISYEVCIPGVVMQHGIYHFERNGSIKKRNESDLTAYPITFSFSF